MSGFSSSSSSTDSFGKPKFSNPPSSSAAVRFPSFGKTPANDASSGFGGTTSPLMFGSVYSSSRSNSSSPLLSSIIASSSAPSLFGKSSSAASSTTSTISIPNLSTPATISVPNLFASSAFSSSTSVVSTGFSLSNKTSVLASTSQSQSAGVTLSSNLPPKLNKKAIYAGLKKRSIGGEQSKRLERSEVEDEPELIPKPKLQAYLFQNYGKNASACSKPVGDELGPMLYLPADQSKNAQLEETDLTRTLNAAAFSILGVSEEINSRIRRLKGDVTREKVAKLKAENRGDLALKDFIGLQIDLEMARDNARAFEIIEKERLGKLLEQEETIAKLNKENEQLKKDIKTAENLANTGMTNLLYELQQKIVIELKARFPKKDWSFIYNIVPDDEEEETKEQDVQKN